VANRIGHFLYWIKNGMMSFYDNVNIKVIINQIFKMKREIISMTMIRKIIQKACKKILFKLNQLFKKEEIRT